MDGRRSGLLLAVVVFGVIGPSGCAWLRAPSPPALPTVLRPGVSLDQVIWTVNHNSSGIRRFSTNHAELSGPDLPVTLRGVNIAFERPKRLRLRARSIAQTELDLGSNDDMFWVWVARNEPPTVYYCRHDQFDARAARQPIPIHPDMLLEAMGIVEFDPADEHRGPFPLGEGRLEIRTIRQTPEGPAGKTTVVHASTGAVLEQHVFDSSGRPVVTTIAREHRRDPLTGLIMPRIVDIQVPSVQFSMTINLGNVTINEQVDTPQQLWTMPAYPGSQRVNLCDPNLRFGPGPPSPRAMLPARNRLTR